MDSSNPNSSQNELHQQKHPPSVPSPEQVWIFSSSAASASSSNEDPRGTNAARPTTCTSTTPATTCNSTASSTATTTASLLLKDRWQHLKQQAAEHVLLQNVNYVAPPAAEAAPTAAAVTSSADASPTTSSPARPWTVAALRPRLVLPSATSLLWSTSTTTTTTTTTQQQQQQEEGEEEHPKESTAHPNGTNMERKNNDNQRNGGVVDSRAEPHASAKAGPEAESDAASGAADPSGVEVIASSGAEPAELIATSDTAELIASSEAKQPAELIASSDAEQLATTETEPQLSASAEAAQPNSTPPPQQPTLTKAAPNSNNTNQESSLNSNNNDPATASTTTNASHDTPAQLYATCPSSGSGSGSHSNASKNNHSYDSDAEENSRDSQSSLQSNSSCTSSDDDGDDDDDGRAVEYDAAYYDILTPTTTTNNSNHSKTRLSSWRSSAAAAAALMVDSATTTAAAAVVFRGRYNNNNNSITEPPPPPSAVESTSTPSNTTQAARIGQSKRTQEHWHHLTDQLPSYQYVVLLGRGRFGVHLKQCYKLAQGVYVDELIPGGNAAQAGNVQIGDVMIAIGSTQCCGIKSSTIATVPQQIADATPRPVHLILATSGAFPTPVTQNATATATSTSVAVVPMNHIDVAVAVFLFQQQQQQEQEQLPVPNVLQWNKDDDNDDSWITGWLNPGVPSTPVSRFYEPWAVQRNTEIVVGTSSANEMCQVALGNALLLCLADPRRFPFVARALSTQSPPQQHTTPTNETTAATEIVANTPHSLLVLLHDLTQYLQLYPLLSMVQRYERALALARLYFLPTTGAATGVFRPPPRDWHTLVPATALRRLELALQQSPPPPRHIFGEFQKAAWEVMTSTMLGPGFVAGHIECARMRAYLRHTAPYRNPPLDVVLNGIETNPSAHNYFLYTLLYTLTKTDLDEQVCNFGENDELVLESTATTTAGPAKRARMDGDGIVAALFVRHRVLPTLLQQHSENSGGLDFYYLEQLWQHFLAPQIGALAADDDDDDDDENSGDSIHAAVVKTTRRLQETLQQLSMNPSDASLRNSLIALLETWSSDLVYDWARRVHPQFCRHKFHEWWCVEVAAQQQQESGVETAAVSIETVPSLPRGCIVRLLRQAHVPVGVTPHKPLHVNTAIEKVADSSVVVVGNEASSGAAAAAEAAEAAEAPLVPRQWHAAECAVVFGTRVSQDENNNNSNMAPIPMPGMDPNGNKTIGRLTCQSVVLDNDSNNHCSSELPPCCLSPEEIPSTLECYAVSSSPFLRKQTLETGASSSSWQSADSWCVQLVNVWVPRADADEGSAKFLFGVALLFTQLPHFNKTIAVETKWEIPDDDDSDRSDETFRIATTRDGVQVTSRVRSLSKLPVLHHKLSLKPSWSQQVRAEQESAKYSNGGTTMGLVLVSQRNVVLAMRETLSMLLREYCPGPGAGVPGYCGPLVDLLGSLRHDDVETNALQCILGPFTRRAIQPWIERPIGSQKEAFLQLAGQQLVRCLPPIPLALAFLTVLLEQKMVLCSSRQSVLISATTVLSELLRPLQWCHLLVPRVPASLAGDLLQYPAPFILGVSSADPGVMDLIRQLPDDITLVDLDVGRVILAPALSHHQASTSTGDSAAAATRPLRSQVLHLAQNLGSVFGRHMDPDTWACDHPWPASENQFEGGSQWDRLRNVAHDFVQELLAGTASCCYWVEEALADATEGASGTTTTPTVFFDEDRFFQIKDAREQYGSAPLFHGGGGDGTGASINRLALSLQDADLVLELFLRCQSMNEYIGTRKRDEMFFSL